MPAKIDLHLTLPDGDVAARRDYPLDEERRDRSDPARQADEREWVAAELPAAIAQLYARAGLEQPGDRIGGLLELLPDDVPHEEATLSAVVATFPIVRDALHGVAQELGVDMATRRIDGRTGTLSGAANLPRLAKQKVGDLKRVREDYDRLEAKVADLRQAREYYDRLEAKVAKLAVAYPVAQRLSGIQDSRGVVDAAIEALTHRAQQIDDRGRVIDAVKEAIGLGSPAVRDNLADEALPAAVARAVAMPEGNPSGQVVTALLASYDLNQSLADDEIFGALQKARREEIRKVAIQAVEDARTEVFAELLERFGLPTDSADPVGAIDEQFSQYKSIGDDVLLKEYSRGKAAAFAELARTFQLKDGDADPAELPKRLLGLYGQQRRLGQLDVLVGLGIESDELPADADVVTWARRAWDTWYDEAVRKGSQRHVEEVAVLRAALGEIGTVYKVLAPMTRNELTNGTLTVEDVKSVAGEVQTQVSTAWAELAILRYLAHDVALITGASQADAAKLTNAALPPQQLANRLSEYKRVLRRDGAVAERDSSRRIIGDIARKLGTPDLRETLVPGAVGDLVRTVAAQEAVLTSVREVLSELRAGTLACADEQLPDVVRQIVLAERSGMAHAADGVKPIGFTLPEGGLADILKNAPWTEQSPARARIEEVADRLADRIETWGERVASRIGSAADRLAAEIDEAVENAREKGDK